MIKSENRVMKEAFGNYAGKQVLAEDSAINTTTVVYTVPAGKVFYLVSAELGTNAGAVGTVQGAIRDDTPTIQKYTNEIKIGSTTGNFNSHSYAPSQPIKLEAGWDLVVISNVLVLQGTLNIIGFETDA